ncbi:MAG: MFS transporter [Bdellovibrio sp.]|nr:MFS transporter [Bdellovibrio sp.]
MNSQSQDKFPLGLVVSSFVNKCGNMGLQLLPMLLIEKNFTVSTASFIMGFTKSVAPLGSFFSGNIIVFLGAKFVLLTTFILSAISMGLIPFLHSPFLLGLFAVTANFAATIYNPVARNIIKETCPPLQLKKYLAWLRSASNLGQVVSSAMAIFLGKMGLMILFLFDAVTSLMAFFIGRIYIQNNKSDKRHDVINDSGQSFIAEGYYTYTLLMAVYFFIYELGFLSFSAMAKLNFGDKGISAFGIAMIINTFLCGTLAVPAARYLSSGKIWITVGFILTVLGPLVLTFLPKTILVLAFGAFLITSGEILVAVFSQTLLLQNCGGKIGQIHYGRGLTIQKTGNFLAGVILFPVVVYGATPWLPFLLAVIIFFVILTLIPKNFFRKT